MILASITPVLLAWMEFFLPLLSGITCAAVLGTMLLLMRLTYNILSRLITRLLAAI